MTARATGKETAAIADALHSSAIHLLRRLRKEDEHTGIGPARLSALSVLVFGGPMRLTALAHIEQVKPPTMTKLVAALEAGRLVRRRADAEDARAVRLEATRAGLDCCTRDAVAVWRGLRRRLASLARTRSYSSAGRRKS